MSNIFQCRSAKTQIWAGRQQKHTFLFLGLPRSPTNVNHPLIQPYSSNRKDMHWNRSKKLVSLPFFMGFERMATPIRKMSFRNFVFRLNSGFPNFCFQERESPAPLNIPTPTLAPDRVQGWDLTDRSEISAMR